MTISTFSPRAIIAMCWIAALSFMVQVEVHAGDAKRPVDPCQMNLNKELSRLRVPGLSAVLVKSGRIVCVEVAGLADVEKSKPVEPETVFVWASVSKTVTATAVMKLVEDGVIELNGDINTYLPFQVRNPNCPEKPITILQLLSHTSSIIENEYHGVYADLYVTGDSPLALGGFLKDYLVPGGAFYDPAKNFHQNCPGKGYSYSNVAVGLLGYLVEVAAGVSFEKYCRDRIFSPLGMQRTAWRLAQFDPDRIAMPYSGSQKKGFKPIGHFGFPTYPDGLLRASATEFARFLLMFMQYGEFQGTRILSSRSVATMRRVHFPELDTDQGLIWNYVSFGPRERVVGHDGTDPGASSMVYFDPKDGAGAILVANGNWKWSRARKLMKKMLRKAGKS